MFRPGMVGFLVLMIVSPAGSQNPSSLDEVVTNPSGRNGVDIPRIVPPGAGSAREPHPRSPRVVSVIRDALSPTARKARSLVVSGRGRLKARDFDGALVEFNAAIHLDPGLAPAYLARGEAWHYKRDYDRALSDYAEAIRLDPTGLRAYHCRGMALEAVKDDWHAFDVYSDAIRTHPDSPEPYIWRSRLRLKLHDGLGARKDAEEVVSIDQTGEAFRLFLIALDVTGDDQLLLLNLKAMIQHEPNNPEHHAALALLRASSPLDRVRSPTAALDSAFRADALARGRSRNAVRAKAAAFAASGDFPLAVVCQLRAFACEIPNRDAGTDVARILSYLARRPYRKQPWDAEPPDRKARRLIVAMGLTGPLGYYLVADYDCGFTLRAALAPGLGYPIVVARWNPQRFQFPSARGGRPSAVPAAAPRPDQTAGGSAPLIFSADSGQAAHRVDRTYLSPEIVPGLPQPGKPFFFGPLRNRE